MKNLQVSKFRVLVRKDLSNAQQAVQAGHAAIQFQHQHPQFSKLWHDTDNRLIYLEVPNEKALLEFQAKAIEQNIPHSIFTEPDLDWTKTAIALAPIEECHILTKKLQLAKFNN